MYNLKKYNMFIDGRWVESESKKTFETLNPENNEPWAKVPEASAKDVDKAVIEFKQVVHFIECGLITLHDH